MVVVVPDVVVRSVVHTAMTWQVIVDRVVSWLLIQTAMTRQIVVASALGMHLLDMGVGVLNADVLTTDIGQAV